MNLIFSSIYAPLIFIALHYFDITIVSSVLILISVIWIFLLKDKKIVSILFPLFYLGIAIFSFFLQDFLVLKVLPLFLALLFSIMIFISYFQEESIVLTIAEKISKGAIKDDEKEYIHQSILFWFFVSVINVVIHFTLYLNANLDFWMFYSAIGWYFLFIFAGVFQFLHRHFIFLRRENV